MSGYFHWTPASSLKTSANMWQRSIQSIRCQISHTEFNIHSCQFSQCVPTLNVGGVALNKLAILIEHQLPPANLSQSVTKKYSAKVVPLKLHCTQDPFLPAYAVGPHMERGRSSFQYVGYFDRTTGTFQKNSANAWPRCIKPLRFCTSQTERKIPSFWLLQWVTTCIAVCKWLVLPRTQSSLAMASSANIQMAIASLLKSCL